MVPEKVDNRPRSAKRKSDTSFDRIWKYFYDQKTRISLSAKELELKEKYELAWKMLCSMYTRKQVAIALVERYDHKITERTAYNYIDASMSLFGDPQNSNKEAQRQIVSEWLIRAIRKAWEDKNFKAYEKLILRYTRLNGLEGSNDADIAKLLKNRKPAVFIFTTDESTLKEQADKLMEDVETPTIDTKYEDITED